MKWCGDKLLVLWVFSTAPHRTARAPAMFGAGPCCSSPSPDDRSQRSAARHSLSAPIRTVLTGAHRHIPACLSLPQQAGNGPSYWHQPGSHAAWGAPLPLTAPTNTMAAITTTTTTTTPTRKGTPPVPGSRSQPPTAELRFGLQGAEPRQQIGKAARTRAAPSPCCHAGSAHNEEIRPVHVPLSRPRRHPAVRHGSCGSYVTRALCALLPSQR